MRRCCHAEFSQAVPAADTVLQIDVYDDQAGARSRGDSDKARRGSRRPHDARPRLWDAQVFIEPLIEPHGLPRGVQMAMPRRWLLVPDRQQWPAQRLGVPARPGQARPDIRLELARPWSGSGAITGTAAEAVGASTMRRGGRQSLASPKSIIAAMPPAIISVEQIVEDWNSSNRSILWKKPKP